MQRRLWLILCAMAMVMVLPAQKKYTGPRPPKPDVPFLLHATNLIETETGEAKEETRKDEMANTISGAASAVKTPLAEPIFLMATDKLAAEKLQLYRMEVTKNGQRELVIPTKKRDKAPRPLRLAFRQLEPGLYRIEANEYLDNGEYCLSPSGSQQVFCFQVY